MKLSQLKQQIEELDAKATGGPWVAVKHGDSAFGPLYQTMKEEEGYRWAINGFHGAMSEEDALFCALSRTAMPELLRRLLVAEEALKLFAADSSWRINGACDPNSGRFEGQTIATAALKTIRGEEE